MTRIAYGIVDRLKCYETRITEHCKSPVQLFQSFLIYKRSKTIKEDSLCEKFKKKNIRSRFMIFFSNQLFFWIKKVFSDKRHTKNRCIKKSLKQIQCGGCEFNNKGTKIFVFFEHFWQIIHCAN